MNEKTIERFWSKVDKDGPVPAHMPHLGPCWVWAGSRDCRGYGRFHVPDRTMQKAHRVAWELEVGPTPPGSPGLCVLHKCDNPSCVRPPHLKLDTQTANVADMDAKGRRNPARGERNGATKLTERDVLAIRERLQSGATQTALGREFGVAQPTIGGIALGRTWRETP